MKLAIIGGSREAQLLKEQIPAATMIDGTELPDAFAADVVIDASHPCERDTPERVAEMCDAQGIPLLRLRRAEWEPIHGDLWYPVEDAQAGYESLAPSWRRVFLCLGHEDRVPFDADPHRWYLIRTRNLEAGASRPRHFAVAEKTGPVLIEQEINLMRRHRIDVLVTRNAGGKGAVPKVSAARALGLPVVMLSRPPAFSDEVASMRKALKWLDSLSRR